MKEKKHLVKTLLTLCILAISLSFAPVQAKAASNTKLMTQYLKYYKQKNYKKAASTLKKMKKSNKDTSLKKMSKKQKTAYKKVVKKYGKSFSPSGGNYLWGYYLADLNKDKKPELLVKYGSCEADVRTFIYTYTKGKAKQIAEFGSGHTGYVAYPGKGVVQVMGHMGYCYVSVITMKNGAITTKEYGSQDLNKDGGDYVLPENYLYNHIKYDSNYNSKVDYSDLK